MQNKSVLVCRLNQNNYDATRYLLRVVVVVVVVGDVVVVVVTLSS